VTAEQGISDWSFSVEETSAGVYQARGVDPSGRRVETSGTNPDYALEKCKRAAVELDKNRRQGRREVPAETGEPGVPPFSYSSL
jgi:hypothetical protein